MREKLCDEVVDSYNVNDNIVSYDEKNNNIILMDNSNKLSTNNNNNNKKVNQLPLFVE